MLARRGTVTRDGLVHKAHAQLTLQQLFRFRTKNRGLFSTSEGKSITVSAEVKSNHSSAQIMIYVAHTGMAYTIAEALDGKYSLTHLQ